VADHVRVGQIEDREAIAVAIELLDESRGCLARRHLGLLVVARNVLAAKARGCGLARPLPFAAAVEEIGHVSVLLGLGDVQLPHPVLGQHLGQGLLHFLLRKRNRDVDVRAVLSSSW